MKKIDLHCHVIQYPQYTPTSLRGQQLLSVEQQLEVLDKLDTEIGVLLPCVSCEAQWLLNTNESYKSIVDANPERFMWFCNIDPRMAQYNSKTDLSFFINHYKSLGAKGVGEITTPLYADDPMMDNLFYHCAQCDMPVLIHIAPQHGDTYGIVDDLGLPRFEKMLKKHPDMKLIGHSAAFWAEISEGLTQDMRNDYPKGKVKEGRLPKLMREYGNLYADLSAGSGSNAMMRDPEYAAKFITEFADRIYYGTDVCSVHNEFQYEFDAFLKKLVEDKMISRENYEKIIRKNAAKLLGIE